MDKVLLLGLLCLQVFLLTTAFTSTEKAVLRTDDLHQQLADLVVKDKGTERMKPRPRRGCGWRAGSCNALRVIPTKKTTKASLPKPVEDVMDN
ncbi:hypothetical protein ATANTOWER_010695 [Ataeniobius toweri]|uniref:Uncharacterized protein n=1 Tax=Ataeniobius toweri TaxID=208326 RepID=A0ABU7B8U0_9TELE|nr:hypothetical protein [Ataeniobius toweri]